MLRSIVACMSLGLLILLIESGHAQSSQDAVSANQSPEQIKSAIARRLNTIPRSPEYLYSADTISGAISTVWMDLTGTLLGTRELREHYDEFYFSALAYRSLAGRAIIRANRAQIDGNMQRAAELIGEYDRYANLFRLSAEGAQTAFDGNAQAASALAKGIYDGSKASVKFGSKFVLGPSASRLVDQAYNGLDFLLNAQEVGVPAAAREATRRALVDVIFDVVPISELKDKTLSDVLGDGANKVIGSSGLYRLLDAAVRSPRFQKELMKVLAAAGRTVTVDTAKALVEKMLADSAAPLAGLPSGARPDASVSTTSAEALGTCSEPVGKEGLSGQEAALALGPALDYYRANAIEAMVKGGILRAPLCGMEMGLMLKGTTGEHRARAIAAISEK